MNNNLFHSNRKFKFMLIIIFCVFTLASISIDSKAQNNQIYDGPGSDYQYPDEHMVFLKGDEESQYLDRNWTTITGLPTGRTSFSKTGSVDQTIVSAQSAPVKEALRFEGNITVQLFASLESQSNLCSLTNIVSGTPAGSETQFIVTVSFGGVQLFSEETNSIVMSSDRTDSHLFTVMISGINATMSPGDVIDFSIDVRHECALTGILWWGTYDMRSGLILHGDLIETELNVLIDQNRMARIELTPISPWGVEDFAAQVLELIGPVEWEEMHHGYFEEDIWLDHFEIPHGTSIGEANRTIYTWSTEKPLSPGNYMVDACFMLTDQDPGERCDSWTTYRFNVPEDSPPLLGKGWAALLIPLSMVLWIAKSLSKTMLPLPAYGVLFILALSCIGPSFSLPDIDSEPYREGGAAPPFILLSHDAEMGAVSLSDLLENSHAVVIGLFTPNSPNSDRQLTDFKLAKQLMLGEDKRVNYIQIATGEGVQAVNLNDYASRLNKSWPLLLDDNSVGISLPSGATDAVIVIDSVGFVTYWKPGSMSSVEIKEAIDHSSSGSGKSPLTIFSLIFSTTLLPLFILGMPDEENAEYPDKAMIPAAGFFLTTAAASIGFSMILLPLVILSALGAGSFWIFIELILSLILIYHGFSILFRGEIIELKYITSKIYSYFPEIYRTWRGDNRFVADAYLGLWLCWLLWIYSPDLIPQGIGSIIKSGNIGILLSPIVILAYVISAGLTIGIIRGISLILGNFWRVLGQLSMGLRPRAWALCSIILGGWTLVSILIGPILSST